MGLPSPIKDPVQDPEDADRWDWYYEDPGDSQCLNAVFRLGCFRILKQRDNQLCRGNACRGNA
jgi:hypothetical protein